MEWTLTVDTGALRGWQKETLRVAGQLPSLTCFSCGKEMPPRTICPACGTAVLGTRSAAARGRYLLHALLGLVWFLAIGGALVYTAAMLRVAFDSPAVSMFVVLATGGLAMAGLAYAGSSLVAAVGRTPKQEQFMAVANRYMDGGAGSQAAASYAIALASPHREEAFDAVSCRRVVSLLESFGQSRVPSVSDDLVQSLWALVYLGAWLELMFNPGMVPEDRDTYWSAASKAAHDTPRILALASIISSWREKSYFLEHRKVIELAVHSRPHSPRVAGVLMNYGGGRLHTAAAEGDGQTLFKLVSERTDLSSTNSEGATALHIAAYSGASEGVRALLELGATADARDAKKMTPLHHAVRSGARDCVRQLLDAGANVNATYDDHKGSALHDAVCRRQRDLVETLLDSGADPTVRNKWNDTPAATARLDAMSVWDDPAVPGVLRGLADLVEARAKSNQAT